MRNLNLKSSFRASTGSGLTEYMLLLTLLLLLAFPSTSKLGQKVKCVFTKATYNHGLMAQGNGSSTAYTTSTCGNTYNPGDYSEQED